MAEDVQQQILDELRKQTAISKKVNKINIICICIFLAVIAITMALTPFIQRLSHSPSTCPQRADTWPEVKNLLDQGEHKKADEMTQRLIKKYPNYYYGYAVRGTIHLELGNLQEAEDSYAKAYDLLPIEENEKMLSAIRKVLKKNATANK
jgi:tetratricopeptide (TPR) repeat protein